MSWLVRSVCCLGATGGRIVGQWGCHSDPSEEKREGGGLALGHPHPSCSVPVALWQVSSYRGPAGQIDNSMSRPALGFYKRHFTASVFVWHHPICLRPSTNPLLCFSLHFLLHFFFTQSLPVLLLSCLCCAVSRWDVTASVIMSETARDRKKISVKYVSIHQRKVFVSTLPCWDFWINFLLQSWFQKGWDAV